MRVTTDDALRRVDARWLGIPGWTFPWRPTRYAAYGVGTPVALLSVLLFTRIFGGGLWSIIYGLVCGIAATTYLMRTVDDERPAGTLLPLVWGELGAPRDSPHNKAQQGIWSLQAIPVFVPDADQSLILLIDPPPPPQRQRRNRNTGE